MTALKTTQAENETGETLVTCHCAFCTCGLQELMQFVVDAYEAFNFDPYLNRCASRQNHPYNSRA